MTATPQGAVLKLILDDGQVVNVKGSSDGTLIVGDVGGSISTWTINGTSGANAAQTLTVLGVAGKSHYVTAMEVFIKAAAAVNDITIQLTDDGVVKWEECIGAGEARGTNKGISLRYAIQCRVGNNIALYVSAGGASVVSIANMMGYTQ